MGNGLPLAATTASRELVEDFRRKTRYFNTFASSPLQAAVGGAVLDVIEQEQLAGNAAAVGAHLKESLQPAMARCAAIGDIRGQGLFVGIEWVNPADAGSPDRDGAVDVVNRLKDKGFLTSNAGVFGNVVKIRPPLVFSRAHADEFVAAFFDCLDEIDE